MQELQTTLPSTAPCEDAFTTASGQRALLLVCFVALVLLALLSYNYASWRTVGLNYEALSAVVAANATLAFVGFLVFHIAVVALGLPGGGILAVTAGVLFGWLTGIAAAMAGAVLGAIAIYLAARTSLGSVFAARSGPWIERLRSGFAEDGISYLIVLRVIGVPGFLVNLGAALLGVGLKPFVLGTLIGILPPVTAFTYLGSVIAVGIAAQNANFSACIAAHPLDADAACPYGIDWSAFPGQELFIAATLLAGLALLPVILKKRSTRHVAV